MNTLKNAAHSLGRFYIQRTMPPATGDKRGPNERPIEYGFALRQLRMREVRTVLDVGPGEGCWPRLLSDCGYEVKAVDRGGSYWRGDYFNRYFPVVAHDIVQSKVADTYDAITCLSVIEHIPDSVTAVKMMASSMFRWDVLILTFPFNEQEYVPNAYDLPDAGYGKGESFITQIYNRAKIEEWCAAGGLHIVDAEYWRCFSGRLWTVGRRMLPMQQCDPADAHLACLALEKS